MKKDLVTSVFLHIVILVSLCLSTLFFTKKIELNKINISIVSSNVFAPNEYKPLELIKEDVKQKNNALDKMFEVNENNSNQKVSKNDQQTSNKSIDLNAKNKDFDTVFNKKMEKSTNKTNLTDPPLKNNIKQPTPLNDEKLSEEQKTKDLFVDSIISGLSKGKLAKLEMEALDNQLKGCWYSQGGYSHSEDLKVELLLTMNPDATIKDIKVLNVDTFNTPLRRTFLDQVLRALHDPKCRRLILPEGAYSSWQKIHIIFDPKAKQ